MNPPHDDVLIIGGGAIGLATALALLDAGRGVRILEAGAVGGGASHGNCGTITPSHAPPLAAPGVVAQALRWMFTPDAPLYLKPRIDPALWHWLLRFAARCNPRDWRQSTQARAALLNDARARLADWVSRYGLQCEFEEEGLDYVFRDPRRFQQYVDESVVLKTFGIATQVFGGTDYEREEPAMLPGVAGAIRFPGDARLRPDRYVAELARVVRERGGVIEEQCRVDRLEPTSDDVRLATSQGERKGGDAVIALGAWSPQLADAIGLPWLRNAIQPGKGYSITYDPPEIVPRRALTLREVSVCVTTWDSGFRLGSTMEFSGYDTTLNEQRLGALERGARKFLHCPVGPVVRERWYGWRPMSRDDIPLIGAAPGHRHLWLATGHGMMGVGMSAGTARMLAELMAGRKPEVDPAAFVPGRFA